jgi:hypothetical protein
VAGPEQHWFGRLERIAGVVAPTTVLTALLFYFGYVATYARYDYFGLDLGILDLSTAETVLRGAEVLYVPLAGLLIGGLFALCFHKGVRALRRRTRQRSAIVVAILLGVVGAALLVRGVIGIIMPAVSRNEFPGVTALAFGVGPPLMGYAVWTLRQPAVGRWRLARGQVGVASALVAVALLGLFWAANSFASAYGRGVGATVGATIRDDRPAVVLDTKERLYLSLPGVTETALPEGPEQSFRYRYRGLYLLVEGGGKIYLVSPEQGGTAGTLAIPFGDDVRVLFV